MLDSELSMFFAIAHCNIPMKTKDMGEIVCNSIASDISLEQKRVPIKGGNNILTRETKNQQIIYCWLIRDFKSIEILVQTSLEFFPFASTFGSRIKFRVDIF